MEVIFEFIVEFIGEFIVEGLIEFSTAQEMPKTVRGICLTVITSLMLGFGGFCGYYAVVESTNTAARVMFGLVALLMLAGCIGFWRKVLRKKEERRRKKEEEIIFSGKSGEDKL